jgi:hypothetical protein
VLNFIAGWTFAGWVNVLVWALKPLPATEAPNRRQVA